MIKAASWSTHRSLRRLEKVYSEFISQYLSDSPISRHFLCLQCFDVQIIEEIGKKILLLYFCTEICTVGHIGIVQLEIILMRTQNICFDQTMTKISLMFKYELS